MRIEKIHFVRIRFPSRSENENREFIFLGVENDGVTGWGETYSLSGGPQALAVDFKRSLIPFALQTPFDRVEDLNYLLSVMKASPEARAALEMAVWSLLSIQNENFLSQRLPQKHAEGVQIPVLKSDPKLWPANAAGPVALKIAPENAGELAEAVGEKFPENPLILDAQGLFSEKNAEILNEFSGRSVLFVLDPFPPAEWEKTARWRTLWKMPVGILRGISDILKLEKICQSHFVDWVVVDPWRAGGLFNAKRYLEMAAENGKKAAVFSEKHTPLGQFWALRLTEHFPEVAFLLTAPAPEGFDTDRELFDQSDTRSFLKEGAPALLKKLEPWVVEREEFW